MNKRLLVLFLGNPILSDDKIGISLGETLKATRISEGWGKVFRRRHDC
jgi:Ni,Fe-hydrogenase maturation factor